MVCLLAYFWVLFFFFTKLLNIQKTLWDRAQCKEKAQKYFIQPTHRSILTPQKNTLKGCVWTVVVVVFPGVWHSHSCLFPKFDVNQLKSLHSWATDADPDEEVSTACCNNWRDSRMTAFPSMCSLRCRADWTFPSSLKVIELPLLVISLFNSNHLTTPKHGWINSWKELRFMGRVRWVSEPEGGFFTQED